MYKSSRCTGTRRGTTTPAKEHEGVFDNFSHGDSSSEVEGARRVVGLAPKTGGNKFIVIVVPTISVYDLGTWWNVEENGDDGG